MILRSTKTKEVTSWQTQNRTSSFAETFKEFPPQQKAASFTIDDALMKMGESGGD
jgi:hypothetical protein